MDKRLVAPLPWAIVYPYNIVDAGMHSPWGFDDNRVDVDLNEQRKICSAQFAVEAVNSFEKRQKLLTIAAWYLSKFNEMFVSPALQNWLKEYDKLSRLE